MKPCWDQAKEVEVMTVTQSNHSLTNLIMWQSPHGEYVRLTLRACSSATAFSSIQSTTPPLLHISASLNSLYVYFCEIYCYLPGTGVHQWRKLWSHDLSWTSSSGAPHYQWFSLSRSQNLSGRMTCWQSAGGHQRGASGKACRDKSNGVADLFHHGRHHLGWSHNPIEIQHMHVLVHLLPSHSLALELLNILKRQINLKRDTPVRPSTSYSWAPSLNAACARDAKVILSLITFVCFKTKIYTVESVIDPN